MSPGVGADRPLAGCTVVVTRAAEQAGGLVGALTAAGAAVVEVPVIATAPPPDDGAALAAALARLGPPDWVAVTSANGAAAVARAGLPPGVRVAAVGPATAAALRAEGIEPALVPATALAEALAVALGPAASGPAASGPAASGTTIVLAQAEAARPVLAERLAAAGWRVVPVVAYRTVPVVPAPELRVAAGAADAITFTSGSTVDAYVAAAGPAGVPPVVVAIGPVTADAARARGLSVTAVAEPHTTEGLVAALVDLARDGTLQGTRTGHFPR